MTNTEDFATIYERHRENVKQTISLNRAAVFTALSDRGIDRVTVNFDGEGDSGQIDDIEVSGGTPASVPEARLTVYRADYGAGKLDSREDTLREAIETLCYDYLSQEQGGWENNDGAFGEFVFDVAARTIDLEFNIRFVDSTPFCRSF